MNRKNTVTAEAGDKETQGYMATDRWLQQENPVVDFGKVDIPGL